jgi:hypothetical protein
MYRSSESIASLAASLAKAQMALLAYIDDMSDPRNAYRAIWGPFSTSEKGRRRRRGSDRRPRVPWA